MVRTKQNLNITVDSEIYSKVKEQLDENLSNTSKYFNKLMIDDYNNGVKKENKRDANIRELAENYGMSIEDVEILTNLYDLCDFAYDYATQVYEDENIFENFLKNSDFITDAIHIKNKHISDEEYNILWEHLGDYKDKD